MGQRYEVLSAAVLSDVLIACLVVASVCVICSIEAQVSAKERTDCELFYLSWISKYGPTKDADRTQQHPRWPELCISAPIHPFISPVVLDLTGTTMSGSVRIAEYDKSDARPAGTTTNRADILSNRLLRTSNAPHPTLIARRLSVCVLAQLSLA